MMKTPPQDGRGPTSSRPRMLDRILSLSSAQKENQTRRQTKQLRMREVRRGAAIERLDAANDFLNDGASTITESSHQTGDEVSRFDVCGNIDQCMLGLHACGDEAALDARPRADLHFRRDWILDGSESEGEDDKMLMSPKSGRRRKFGDAALDQMLGMLEIENASCATSGSSLDGDNSSAIRDINDAGGGEDEKEEVIEFADFSEFDAANGGIGYDAHHEKKGAPESAGVLRLESSNLQHDVLYEHEKNEMSEEKDHLPGVSNDSEEEEGRGHGHAQAQDEFSSPGYRPPQSIECLVSDLDKELDSTIKKCLSTSLDKSSVTESEGSSSHDGDRAATPSDALNEEGDFTALRSQPRKSQKEYKQPLLMSSMLLESLPAPMPSMSSNDPIASLTRPIASLTRRIQQGHMAHKTREAETIRFVDAMQREDELLKQKLADTIHAGYYSGTGEDGDFFDSIVLEEVMNVPWPFHKIDLEESLLNEDDGEPDSDESAAVDHLNFDTYIANRLSELDFANAEIAGCMLARAGRKEDAISRGVDDIFAAELDVHTALLFAESSREFLHRAKNGYRLPDGQARHDVVTGGLDVLSYADSKDRLRDLLDTIDIISSIRDREAQWRRDASARMIAPQQFQRLVDDARGLAELVRGEEVLNLATSLAAMRERIHNFPDALRGRIEESLADLLARMLGSEKCDFVEYSSEFESLLRSWLSCWQLRRCDDGNAEKQSRQSIIGAEWSGCVLRILCFEASRAFAFSLVDSYYDELKTADCGDHGTLEGIESQLGRIKFDPKDESELKSLSQRLLVTRLGGGHHSKALSSSFFFLCSRLVELMNLYDLTLQSHKVIMDSMDATGGDTADTNDVCHQRESDKSESNVSSISSDKQSMSSTADASAEKALQNEISTPSVPENLEFKTNAPLDIDIHRAIHAGMEQLRRALWKKCEESLIHLIEFYMMQGGDLGVHSGEGSDFVTRNFRLTYDVLLQFTCFSSHFLGIDEDNQCSSLEDEMSKLYSRHVRSVHIDAMKITGELLRHESWHLAPLELAIGAPKADASVCEKTMLAVYQAVGDLLIGSLRSDHKSEQQLMITSRSEQRGYMHCASFRQCLDKLTATQSDCAAHDKPHQFSGCAGVSAKEFMSKILSFVEMKPCGEQSLSILTQSSANGLVKWTAHLLAIGKSLPLIADEASDAVMALFDLYILTVFRFCAKSKPNEDVLIGLGRGTAARTASLTSVSLTMEADAVAPLPGERSGFVPTREFIHSSRQRLDNIVNLDGFQSPNDDICPTSPRSKDAVVNAAKRLEKEAAAIHSCFFVAILVDVASKIFSKQRDGQQQQPLWADLKDMATMIDESNDGSKDDEHSLDAYAVALVRAIPNLVTQATRFASVNSISGKQLIFQIICCGRAWETRRMKEQSNEYVDSLCERAAFIWSHMSSSTRLSPPALRYTWDQLVWSVFMLLLEGFSKIANCSTEGRSLMSMDLATLSHGLIPETVKAEVEEDHPGIDPPPQACREDMMRYVDTFIKVFYFPNEDIINWISDNSENYHLDHSLSLVTSKSGGLKDKRFMADGQKSVMNIYDKLK